MVRPDGLEGVAEDPSLTAASARLPDGAYTTLRTYHGDRILRLGDHLRRLAESCRRPGPAVPIAEDSVRRTLGDAVRSAGHPESRIRLTLAPPALFVSVEPFQSLPPSLYRDGVACVTVPLRRADPQAKDTRFIAEAARAQGGLPVGVHEGLLVGDDGAILEGLSSNFFGVVAGTVRTEEERALGGITRGLVLELAEGVAPVVKLAVGLGEAPALDEAFLTSVSRGILPVVRIDGRPVGAGRPGTVTAELSRRLDERIEREARSLFD